MTSNRTASSDRTACSSRTGGSSGTGGGNRTRVGALTAVMALSAAGVAAAGPATAAGPELVVNPGLETAAGARPNCFLMTGWGANTVTSGYSTDTATRTGRSWRVTLTNRTSGDHKLLPSDAAGCAPAVSPGKTYDVKVGYKSSAAVNGLTLFRQTAAGWSWWTDIKALPASAAWTTATGTTPAIPAGTLRLAAGVSIAANGTLLTDNYSITETGVATPPPPAPVQPGGGTWQTLAYNMPVKALHTTVLRDGRVLLIAGSGNDEAAFKAKTFTASIWDPNTAAFTTIQTPEDMFCAGHVTLADGRVLIQGGTKDYTVLTGGPAADGSGTYAGLKSSYIFDPATNAFTPAGDTQTGHWYPTLTKLGNGDVWMAGGINENREGTVNTEMWSQAGQRWLTQNEVKQTWSYWGLYPHMLLAADGRLFYTGARTFRTSLPGTGASLYNWETGAIQDVPGLRDKDLRDQAASFFLGPVQDQKVVIVGGGDTENNVAATGSADIIDLKQAAPAYRPIAPLPGQGKLYVNAVALPDRTVLTSNGGVYNRAGNVMTAAVLNSADESWTSVPADPVPRNYHSTAVLLPDGRVVTAGSNPADGSFELRMSVFSPGYMTKNRPAITAAPTVAAPGSTHTVSVTGGSGVVGKVSLLSPMSVTHQTDTNMRLVDVPATGTGGTVQVTIPTNRNIVPPGPYMLVVQDTAGVPSIAKWVNVQ